MDKTYINPFDVKKIVIKKVKLSDLKAVDAKPAKFFCGFRIRKESPSGWKYEPYNYVYSKEEVLEGIGQFIDGNNVYVYARVILYFKSTSEILYFKTDKEAESMVNNLIEKHGLILELISE